MPGPFLRSMVICFVCAAVATCAAMIVKAEDVVMTEEQKTAAVSALKPLEALAGDFAIKVAFGSLADAQQTRDGTARCRMRSGGFAFSIEKHEEATAGGSEYDDLMVMTYNPKIEKIDGLLYQKGNPPRHFTVEVTAKGVTLNYEPLKVEDQTMTTREEISHEAGGAIHWQVKRLQPDGTYDLVLEILGTPKTPR